MQAQTLTLSRPRIRVWHAAQGSRYGMVHILKPARASFRTFEHGSYNEALSFAKRSAALNPSKPYKQIRADGPPVWCVTVPVASAMQSRPEYVSFPRTPGFTGIARNLIRTK